LKQTCPVLINGITLINQCEREYFEKKKQKLNKKRNKNESNKYKLFRNIFSKQNKGFLKNMSEGKSKRDLAWEKKKQEREERLKRKLRLIKTIIFVIGDGCHHLWLIFKHEL